MRLSMSFTHQGARRCVRRAGARPAIAGALVPGLVGALMLLGGCAVPQPGKKPPGAGQGAAEVIHWRVYRNDFFGFSMRVPRDWHSADSAFMQAYRASGMKVITGDRQDLALAVAEQDPRAVLLVTAMRFPVGTQTEEFNDNIACAAIKVSDVPAVENGADYLNVSTGGDDQQVSTIRHMSIAGRAFYVRNVVHRDNAHVAQEVAATVHEGYAFTCTLTYSGDSLPQTLYQSLSSIRIAK